MNMFKKNGGFTLVELIVVIAILAILAAVAVPAYNGYISKAQAAADVTALAAVKTACMATYATEGTVTQIIVTDGENDGIQVWLDGKTADEDAKSPLENENFAIYYGGAFSIELATGATATWTAADSEWVIQ